MSDRLTKGKRPFCLMQSKFVAAFLLLCGLCAAAIFFLSPAVVADEHSASPLVLELRLEGVVDPILATYIDEGLADAANRHAALVLITMDTPGGLSTFDAGHDSAYPRITSAGCRLCFSDRWPRSLCRLLHPALCRHRRDGAWNAYRFRDPGHGHWRFSADANRRCLPKEDQCRCHCFSAKFSRRSAAATRCWRKRPSPTAALSPTKEALEGKMIDLIVSSPDELVRQLDGRSIIRFDGTQTKLSLKNAERRPFENYRRGRNFLPALSSPIFSSCCSF